MRSTRWSLCGLVALLAVALAVQGQDQSKKLKVLIVTGFDVASHLWHETTEVARATLEETGQFEVRVSEDVGIFESSALDSYDAVLLNYGF